MSSMSSHLKTYLEERINLDKNLDKKEYTHTKKGDFRNLLPGGGDGVCPRVNMSKWGTCSHSAFDHILSSATRSQNNTHRIVGKAGAMGVRQTPQGLISSRFDGVYGRGRQRLAESPFWSVFCGGVLLFDEECPTGIQQDDRHRSGEGLYGSCIPVGRVYRFYPYIIRACKGIYPGTQGYGGI